jgi:membrane protein YdbS with pleckstrin-like domain
VAGLAGLVGVCCVCVVAAWELVCFLFYATVCYCLDVCCACVSAWMFSGNGLDNFFQVVIIIVFFYVQTLEVLELLNIRIWRLRFHPKTLLFKSLALSTSLW